MKLDLRLLGIGLLFSGAFMLTSCQGSGDEGSADAARESVAETTDAAQDAMNNNAQLNTATPAQNNATQADPNAPTTTITFDEPVHDFGTVEKGGKVSHTYTFTNTGSEPLIITNAKASCGCTVPTWPKEPIAPGESGEIPVEFSGKAKGPQNKTVTITANTNPPQTRLTIKGTVTDPAES